jgi:hypothetical protein
MANIHLSNLPPTGTDLFLDSESFLSEITDRELNSTHGGDSLALALQLLLMHIS